MRLYLLVFASSESCHVFSNAPVFFFLNDPPPPEISPLPYTTLFRSPGVLADVTRIIGDLGISIEAILQKEPREGEKVVDRKSTRLNSSHGYISYAVFCLKKKKNTAQFARKRRR